MTNSRRALKLTLAALGLTAHLLLPALPPAASAQNTNFSTTTGGQNTNSSMTANRNDNMGVATGGCEGRCNHEYRRCVRGGKNRKSCSKRLRACARRCPEDL